MPLYRCKIPPTLELITVMLLAGCLTLPGTRSYNMKFPEVSFCY
jgi:hypothetical protein